MDQYAEWSGRKKEAERHMEELKEEILEFSSCHEMENIQGSSCVLRISRGRLPKLPPAASAEREELERALRDGGVWDDAINPDARKVASLLEKDDLAQELRARLERMVTWEETSTLRFRNR